MSEEIKENMKDAIKSKAKNIYNTLASGSSSHISKSIYHSQQSNHPILHQISSKKSIKNSPPLKAQSMDSTVKPQKSDLQEILETEKMKEYYVYFPKYNFSQIVSDQNIKYWKFEILRQKKYSKQRQLSQLPLSSQHRLPMHQQQIPSKHNLFHTLNQIASSPIEFDQAKSQI